jgi:ribulose-bisphosphate carboxylase large chain
MTVKELIKTLNPHQSAYINMDLADPKNGDYMLAVFHLIP